MKLIRIHQLKIPTFTRIRSANFPKLLLLCYYKNFSIFFTISVYHSLLLSNKIGKSHPSILSFLFPLRNQNLRTHQRFLNSEENSQQKSMQIFQNYYICTIFVHLHYSSTNKTKETQSVIISSSIFSFNHLFFFH